MAVSIFGGKANLDFVAVPSLSELGCFHPFLLLPPQMVLVYATAGPHDTPHALVCSLPDACLVCFSLMVCAAHLGVLCRLTLSLLAVTLLLLLTSFLSSHLIG